MFSLFIFLTLARCSGKVFVPFFFSVCDHGFCSGFRSLLILDDIWDSTVLKAFDIQCRILLTTRNRSLTDSVSGMLFLTILYLCCLSEYKLKCVFLVTFSNSGVLGCWCSIASPYICLNAKKFSVFNL